MVNLDNELIFSGLQQELEDELTRNEKSTPQPSLAEASVPASPKVKKERMSTPILGKHDEIVVGSLDSEEEDVGYDSDYSDCNVEERAYNSQLRQEFEPKVREMLNGLNKPYDPSTERRPEMPAYHPAFASVEQLCEEIPKGAMEILQKSQYKDAETERMLNQISEHQNVKRAPARRVGMIGDSGVGKSSLLNTLLDTPNLAYSGSLGGACTCVVTEYRQASARQTEPFEAKIEFLGPKEIKKIMQDHFRDYYRYNCEPIDDLDEDAREQLDTLASTAYDTFQALFCNRPEFCRQDTFDEEALRGFFGRAELASDRAMIGTLCSWSNELIAEFANSGSVAVVTADTAEALGAKIERFVRTVPLEGDLGSMPSPWPLVHIVRVGLQSQLLNQGIIIADLPGLSDANKTRTNVTQGYMRSCDFTWIVAMIPRVESDQMVKKRLIAKVGITDAHRILVCTMTDQGVNVENVRLSEYKATPQDTEEYKRILRFVALQRNASSRVGKKLDQLKYKPSKLLERHTELKLREKIGSTLLLEKLVILRNKKVEKEMIRQFKNWTRKTSATLTVACVSKEWYALHTEGYTEAHLPVSIAATGIPNLRFEALKLPALAKFNVLKQHSEGRLPSLVYSLKQWSEASVIERRDELRLVVATPRKDINEKVATFMAELHQKFEEYIVRVIRGHSSHWASAGNKTIAGWMVDFKAAATFVAWCRRSGEHVTKDKKPRSWTGELLAPVQKDMEEQFQRFEIVIGDIGERSGKDLVASLDTIEPALSDLMGFSLLPMENFVESLTPRRNFLKTCINDWAAEIIKDCRDIKLNVIADDMRSYVPRAMNPLYRQCTEITGPKSHMRRTTLLKDAIARGDPFAAIAPGVKKSFQEALDRKQPQIARQVRMIFDAVLEDFDRRFTVEEVHNPARDVLRQQMQVYVKEAKAKIDGPIAGGLARAQGKA